jgi:hypothetical protein
MPVTPRFVFRGNAVVFGGRIYRPDDLILETRGSSSLPVVGGRSRSQFKALDLSPYLTIKKGESEAEGVFTASPMARLPPHRLDETAVPSRTIVTASAEGIEVGRDRRVAIGRLSARLQSTHQGGIPSGSQPTFLLERTFIEGMTIDGSMLRVHLNIPGHNADGTFDRVAKRREQLRRNPGTDDRTTPDQLHQLDVDPNEAGGSASAIPVTILDRFEWVGEPSPHARISGHTVHVKDFGTIFFGEMLITGNTRRLTMVRMQLGSPESGSVAFGEVETNGSWYPPIP